MIQTERHIVKRISLVLISTVLSMSAWAALLPQIEMDRLLLQAKAALDAKNFAQASESLANAEKLGIALPDTFYYHSGRANAGAGRLEQAQASYSKYLEMSGTKGKFYQEALIGMNEVEAAVNARNAAAAEEKVNCAKQHDEDLATAKRALRSAEAACELSTYSGNSFCFGFDRDGGDHQRRNNWERSKNRVEELSSDSSCH